MCLTCGHGFRCVTLCGNIVVANVYWPSNPRDAMLYDTGLIMARISKDLDETDVRLPMIIEMSSNFVCVIVISLGLVAAVFPYFLVSIPFIAVMYVHAFEHRYFPFSYHFPIYMR